MMEASAPQDINAAVILRKRSMDEVNLEPNIKEAKRAWGRPGQQEHHGRQRTIIVCLEQHSQLKASQTTMGAGATRTDPGQEDSN
jgi:hypothetical protein